MICAYLLHKNLAAKAMDAMNIYAQQRSKVRAGLTVPSQKRYGPSTRIVENRNRQIDPRRCERIRYHTCGGHAFLRVLFRTSPPHLEFHSGHYPAFPMHCSSLQRLAPLI